MLFDRTRNKAQSEAEEERKLQSLRNEYELRLEEMKVDQALLEVYNGLRGTLLDGLMKEVRRSGNGELKELCDRIELYESLQFSEPQPEEQEFSILELLDGLTKERREEADTAGIRLRCSVKSIRDTKVTLPVNWLAEILRVLVSEALLASCEGDSVMLTAEQLENDADGKLRYRFTVRDSDTVPLPGSAELYFTPFGTPRADVIRNRMDPAIAGRLAQLMDAELGVSSSEEGSSVSIEVSGEK